MNIKEAKEQVKNTVNAYLTKDDFGEYRIPVNRQRPLFLIGPPGIGKTDIMAQVAGEMNIGLVAYSMTHHTRQSALGLPYIKEQEYGGDVYRTTEYTMSEIIASVYDEMKDSGNSEGILFLDEINCISETLAPSMLQFLQTKKFGKHNVPDGWVIITAGNPLEYNDSVREFDLATTDRLKVITVEPNYESWKEYAADSGVHGSIMTYLDVHPDDFYHISTSIGGREFVTARGWVDLSEMIKIYEEGGLAVDLKLITQYVHSERIARDFAIFYDMFFKYQREFHIRDILDGEKLPEVVRMARLSRFDERLIIIQQFTDALAAEFQGIYKMNKGVARLLTIISENKDALSGDVRKALDLLSAIKTRELKAITRDRRSGTLSYSKFQSAMQADSYLKELIKHLELNSNRELAADKVILEYLAPVQSKLRLCVEKASASLENAFIFIETAYAGDKEMLLFVTHLSKNRYCADFIMNYGSDKYKEHSKQLRFDQREQDIIRAANELCV